MIHILLPLQCPKRFGEVNYNCTELQGHRGNCLSGIPEVDQLEGEMLCGLAYKHSGPCKEAKPKSYTYVTIQAHTEQGRPTLMDLINIEAKDGYRVHTVDFTEESALMEREIN